MFRNIVYVVVGLAVAAALLGLSHLIGNSGCWPEADPIQLSDSHAMTWISGLTIWALITLGIITLIDQRGE
jgi:hypothetical protein